MLKTKTVAWRRSPLLESATPCQITVDGHLIAAVAGECLATALAAGGYVALGASPGGRIRGVFCMMGVCQQCVAEVDGIIRPTCMVVVREGMDVRLSLEALS